MPTGFPSNRIKIFLDNVIFVLQRLFRLFITVISQLLFKVVKKYFPRLHHTIVLLDKLIRKSVTPVVQCKILAI